ncbi:hypothetical protein M409DRAFT_64215 [Zasmidium cellare ATCC 36951]|uniref:Uncharacterized protein n=1 Tax=Zasmidium cellare ATCC 36951 TaxID=1080233 RepID=A0A6A6CYN3_ZASCE|nr:uncharacterized protein M409DRAFT_64215 [Zasmidium cellare ATCC 36951]KAF2170496.1 hypothetical protein M409DRAFT_64215 [Zasmidium cellare ATCC 36951]
MAEALYEYPLKPVSWNERDLLLFANSIGCEPSELHFLYELHPSFSAFPTYPIALTFKHDYTSVSSFKAHFTKHLTPPKNFINGFPTLDIERVVDGERTLEHDRPIPISSSSRNFAIRSQVIGVCDKGKDKATIVKTEHLLIEVSRSLSPIGGRKQEAVFTRMSETAVFMGQGGWGGPNDASPSTPPSPPANAPPTKTYRHEIPKNANLLYRLNGDYNPLHATNVKAAVVQPTPIMHGLYSWNVVSRLILSTFADSRPGALMSFRARFAAPVRPGDVLETDMWDHGDGEVRFVAKVGGRVVLDKGVAVLNVNKGIERGRL